MIRTLKLSTGFSDQDNSFVIVNPALTKRFIVALHRDYQAQGDGVYWAMQRGACIKSHYTEADHAETRRLKSENAIQNGEYVLIDGKQYKCRILGNYSDCAIFDPV